MSEVAGILKLKQENAKAIGIVLVVVAVIVIGFYIVKKFFGGIGDLSQKLGLNDSPELIAAKTSINKAVNADSTSYWTPEFYNNAKQSGRSVPVDVANNICNNIYNAYGFFSYLDNPENTLAAFKQLPSKYAVSFIVVKFQVLYNADLVAWLTRKSDTDKDKIVLGQIINYCNSLPTF